LSCYEPSRSPLQPSRLNRGAEADDRPDNDHGTQPLNVTSEMPVGTLDKQRCQSRNLFLGPVRVTGGYEGDQLNTRQAQTGGEHVRPGDVLAHRL